MRSRAVAAIAIIAPFAILALLSPPVAPEGSWGDTAFDFAGWILFTAGAAARWWATLYIGGRKLDTFISDGPYSICRNPLYVGTFLMGVAIACFLQSVTFAAGFAIATIYYMSVTVPAEESLLRARFGAVYVAYCQRVPRYVPRLRGFQSPERLEINVGGLRAEALRTLQWIWLPIVCEVIAELRTASWWPRPWHFP